ncbi:MAG: NAD-binding protein [Chitinispirillaceae bacterium]|nr:NAD-binding protein [Chitinispirillaceae bacterium]
MENESELKKKTEIPPVIRILFIFLGMILFVAFLYSKLENISFFDSIYWVITTCSTVGYGDISPKTVVAKVLTMVLMVSGVALLGYLLSTMSDQIITFNMRKMMGLSKVKASEHIILMGWNVVARMALDELSKMGTEVVVIDNEQHPEVSSMVRTHFILGSYHDETALKKAGIQTAKAIILAMESDSEVILAISVIRKINRDITIIGRIDDLYFAGVARQAGCDRVVSPSEIGGNMLFSALTEPAVVRWFSEANVMNCGVDFIDVNVSDTAFAGKTIGEIQLDDNSVVAGIYKAASRRIEALPERSMRIENADTLIVITRNANSNVNHQKKTSGKRIMNGHVLLVGWNPTVRSAVNELHFSKRYEISVLSDVVPVSEKEHYEQQGITFIEKDISKLSLKNALENHDDNVIVGIEDDSDAILSSHIIKGLFEKINIIVRVDDPVNNDAAEPIGANTIISPSVIGGHLLAHSIVNPFSVTLLMEASTSTIGVDVSQCSIESASKLDGAKVSDFTFEKRFIVVAIERIVDGTFLTMPSGDEILHAGDTLVFLHL